MCQSEILCPKWINKFNLKKMFRVDYICIRVMLLHPQRTHKEKNLNTQPAAHYIYIYFFFLIIIIYLFFCGLICNYLLLLWAVFCKSAKVPRHLVNTLLEKQFLDIWSVAPDRAKLIMETMIVKLGSDFKFLLRNLLTMSFLLRLIPEFTVSHQLFYHHFRPLSESTNECKRLNGNLFC